MGRLAAFRGFTLVELLAVIGLMALLAAIALPNYGAHISKARRADARSAVLEIAAAQERVHFERNQYTAVIGDVWTHQDDADFVSPEGYYLLTVATTDGGQRHSVTASARGGQLADTNCLSFTVDQSGRKSASDGNIDTSDKCW